MIRAITFDFWNTLVAEGGEAKYNDRATRWTSAISDAGHDVPQEVVERAMTDLWSWFNGRWEGNEVVTPAMLVAEVLVLLRVPHDPELAKVMEATLHDGADPRLMVTAPGIGDTLEELRSAGVRVGIICDVGMTPSTALRRYLDHHGLLAHFDNWSFSDEVGCYKPDPRIFAHASSVLGVADPAELAHIGDLRRTDVAGARGAGWRSLRYVGFYDDQTDLAEADVVVADHRDLPEVLGIDG